jgi:acyl carrier protein
MQREEIQATFAAVLEKVVKVPQDEVARDKRLREDLHIDSLSLVEVAVAAEDAFGILIPDEDLERFQTVSDAIDYIQRSKVVA